MVSTIIVGDTHIGSGSSLGRAGIGSHLNSRTIDQINILEWVFQQAVETGSSNIIITGDVFDDAKPHPTLISLFIDWLKQCIDQSIQVHILCGNHDLLRSGQFNSSSLDIISASELEGIYFYKDIDTLELPGITFTMVPFRDRRAFNTNSNKEALNLLRTKISYECRGISNLNTKVIIGHLALKGSLPVNTERLDMHNELFCPLDMFDGFQYGLFGHIHRFQVFKEKPNHIAHIGSMDLGNFGEAGHKKYIAIIDNNTDPKLKYVQIPSRPLKQIDILIPSNTLDTTEFAVKSIIDQNIDVKKAIVKVHISLENQEMLNADRIMIENQLMRMGAFYVPRIDQERKVSQIKKNIMTDNLDSALNEFTAIKTYAEAAIEKDLQNDFISLAHSIVKETTNASN